MPAVEKLLGELGDTSEAVECLEKVLSHGAFYKAWAEKDSDLDSIRHEPRFQALLQNL